jgi:sulfotransferase family protein
VIIGAQKAGTSALYDYLGRHPHVRPAITKEVHYFDMNHDRGERWYRGHFPRQRALTRPSQRRIVTGEATPYYLFHPLVPGRLAATVPKAKLIVLLRDPVRRAVSHFYHEVALGLETRDLETALREEPQLMAEERERIANGLEPSPAHQHASYASRGLYAEQLRRWFAYFDPRRVLVLPAERLGRDGGATYRRALRFLGLPDDGRWKFRTVNRRVYPTPQPETLALLQDRFAEANASLMDLIGPDRADEFPWATTIR